MTTYFDLVAVQYDEFYSNETAIYKAPEYALKVGDVVETDFGRGTVVEVRNVWAGDPLFKFIYKYRKLHKVNSVLQKLKYEEEKNV